MLGLSLIVLALARLGCEIGHCSNKLGVHDTYAMYTYLLEQQ